LCHDAIDAFGIDPRGAPCRTLAVHQGTGTSVAIAGQVGNLLAWYDSGSSSHSPADGRGVYARMNLHV